MSPSFSIAHAWIGHTKVYRKDKVKVYFRGRERRRITMAEKRARRTYSEEQKKQLVELYNHGKSRSEIIRE
jgi:hypothetical protein